MCSNTTAPHTLIHQLREAVEHPEWYESHGPEIASLARRTATAVEGPFERFYSIVHAAFPIVAIRICQEHKVIHTLTENASKGQPTTNTSALSRQTGLSRSMLETLLEYLASKSYVNRVSSNEFAPTSVTNMLLTPLFMDGIKLYHDTLIPVYIAWNSFLSDPKGRSSVFQLAHNTPNELYEWMKHHPDQGAAFHTYMNHQLDSLPGWLDAINFLDEFAQNTSANTPLFVDVGGGKGQQCAGLLTKYPNLKGRVILQDLSSVIQDAVTDSRVERMSYDFFTEQPVKHARAYYFRQVFHNNDDSSCTDIIKSLLPAMGQSSVLLIDDIVLSDEEPPSEYIAGISLTMMALFTAYERRESQWRSLLDKTGLRITAIKRFTLFGESIIVAVKK